MIFHLRSAPSLLLTLITLSSLATAQQNILTSGNTRLPACGQQCTTLISAATGCQLPGSSLATEWNCFCQSAFLKTLYTSPNGICDAFCTNPTDNQNVMTWYKSNCGTDDGASEHANGAAPSASTTTAPATTSTSAAPSATTSSKTPAGVTNSGSSNAGAAATSNEQPSWISTHYQWIIFVVVVIVGFAVITVLAVWYKRRYYRRQDQMNGVFNAGVSEQAPPPMSNHAADSSLPARDGGSRFA